MKLLKQLEALQQLANPCKSFNGTQLSLTTIQMEIPKSESKIEYHDWMNGEIITYEQWKLNLKTNPRMAHMWRFLWNTAPITVDDFSLHITEVFDVPNTDVYLVSFLLMVNTNLNDYTHVLTNTYDWEDLCLPWKTFTHYTYK